MSDLQRLLETPFLSVRPLDARLDTTSDEFDDVEIDLSDAYDDDEASLASDAHDDDEQLGMDVDDGIEDDTSKEEDPDRQGSIRVVKNAHLIYKRKDDNNMYTELWVYKEDMSKQISKDVYYAILAGTDIPRGSNSSPDGTQTVSTWMVGPAASTVTYVEIKGIPN